MKETINECSSQFEGELLGRSGSLLVGWVRNLVAPYKFVSIELYGDGQWLATSRTGLNLSFKDSDLNFNQTISAESCFAFFIETKQWQSIARFEVYIANVGVLPGVYFTHLNNKFLPQIQSSSVFNSLGLRLTGWVWDALNPKYKHIIRAYENGHLLAESIANKHSYELAEFGHIDTYHGFSLTLPMDLADGLSHQIKVLTAQGKELIGSPIAVMVPETTYCAWVDSLAIESHDSQLLKATLTHYNRSNPLSVDFSTYPSWFNRFGQFKTVPFTENLTILIIIDGLAGQKQTLASLIDQTYKNWFALVINEVEFFEDSRISYIKQSTWLDELRKYLSAGFDIASFIAAGDTVDCHALATVVNGFNSQETQIVYSDCDKVLPNGSFTEPWFKPDWDPDLFLACPLVHHLFACRVINLSVDHPYIGDVNAWSWLAVESVGDNAKAILHIPNVLYHQNSEATQILHQQAQLRCDARLAPEITRLHNESGQTKITYKAPDNWPTVGIIVPTRDHIDLLARCLDSLLNTDYPNLEIMVVDNDSVQQESIEYLGQVQDKGIKVITYSGPFNFSAINNRAVSLISSSIIGLINNDVEALDPNWLKIMVRQLLRPNVGVVGAKLLWANDMVQHAGVVLGLQGVMGHTGNDWHKNEKGYFGYNLITRTVSAVTAACLICKREDYLAVGGLDEINFPVNFNDVDFCLKLREQGKRSVWTPDAQLIHAESASRGGFDTPAKRGHLAREKRNFMDKWQHLISFDPYYNPNLNLDGYSYTGIAIPPRKQVNE